jgi:tRNA-2-methylthio-N6-dimethylallyladenosine synthase
MNVADSTRLAERLYRLGYLPADTLEDADIVVVNSCSIRESAEERVSGKLGSLVRLKRQKPHLAIALTGCMVVPDRRMLHQRFPMVDLFFHTLDEEALVQFVTGRFGSDGCLTDIKVPPRPAPVSAYVTVIHGCDYNCTYCIVPFRRGRERSRPIDEIVREAEQWVARGAREITLLGQNVTAYGHDLPGTPELADVLEAVSKVPGVLRVRFLTGHPNNVTPRLIEAVADIPQVCEWINLPIQAGDDEILRAMDRGYTVAEYISLIERIRARVNEMALITDVIVGFPGETEAQFENTYKLCQTLRFDVVHVAAFSPRPGTKAATMPNQVPEEEKKRRLRVLDALQEKISFEINSQLVGRCVEVLVEEGIEGKWKGRTRTGKLVFFNSDEQLQGQLVKVVVEQASAWSLKGRLA